MTRYVTYSQNGELAGFLQTSNSLIELELYPNAIPIGEDTVLDRDTHYVKNGVITEFTEAEKQKRKRLPHSPGYSWNMEVMDWVNFKTADEIKLDLVNSVNSERDRRNWLPIDYAGTKFDADQISQSNLRGWITSVNSGQPLPDNFVWRDYYNVNHPADVAWLSGLNTVIINRTTALYETSWIKKQEIESLNDRGQLLLYLSPISDYTMSQQPNWPGVKPWQT